MLDFLLKDGKTMTLENIGNELTAQLWDEDGLLMLEINWDVDSISDMLFTE